MHESDAFHRVGRALIASWSQWSAEPDAGDRAAISARQRNRLLDETGSDYRPLVDLLIDLGHATRPALQRLGHAPLSASAWDTARAPIVHQIVSTRYLQPDVARWAVDVWGRALGVSPVPITRDLVAAPQLRTTEMMPYAAPTAGAVAARANATLARATARFGTRPPLTGGLPSAPKPARPTAPSWAGGPASFGVGAKVKPGARAALANSDIVGAAGAGNEDAVGSGLQVGAPGCDCAIQVLLTEQVLICPGIDHEVDADGVSGRPRGGDRLRVLVRGTQMVLEVATDCADGDG